MDKSLTITVPPGPLGILLVNSSNAYTEIEGFAPLPNGEKGTLEKSGLVLPGSIFRKINGEDVSSMSFTDVGLKLSLLIHMERNLEFQLPIRESNSLNESFVGDLEFQLPKRESSFPPELNLIGNQSIEDKPESSIVFKNNSPFSFYKSKSSEDYVAFLHDGQDLNQCDMSDILLVEAPPGPLGLLLQNSNNNKEDDDDDDDAIQVSGFCLLSNGEKGELEKHGKIVKGSVLIELNGEDVTHKTLDEVKKIIFETSHQIRTLKFILPDASKMQPNDDPSHFQIDCSMDINQQKEYENLRIYGGMLSPRENVQLRRKNELKLIMEHDENEIQRGECWFLVETEWIQRWGNFVAAKGPLPGPITNETLYKNKTLPKDATLPKDTPPPRDTTPPRDALGSQTCELKGDLQLQKDYRCVNPLVWAIFVRLHGAGPRACIPRYVLDINAKMIPGAEVNKILEQPTLRAGSLGSALKQRCRKMDRFDQQKQCLVASKQQEEEETGMCFTALRSLLGF